MIAELERLVRPSDVVATPAAIPGPICARCGCTCGHVGTGACPPCRRWWRRADEIDRFLAEYERLRRQVQPWWHRYPRG